MTPEQGLELASRILNQLPVFERTKIIFEILNEPNQNQDAIMFFCEELHKASSEDPEKFLEAIRQIAIGPLSPVLASFIASARAAKEAEENNGE